MIFETQYHLEDKINIPPSIFSFPNLEVDTKVVLNYWREHCFECAPPICYQSCNNYLERNDGKCRLLQKGISPVIIDNTIHYRLRFRKWAKIESYSAKYSLDFRNYNRIRELNFNVDRTSQKFSSGVLGSLPLRGLSFLVDRLITSNRTAHFTKGAFYFEFYSYNTQEYNFIIEQSRLRKSFKVFKGWNRVIVPIENIYDAIRFFPDNDFPADIIIKHAFSFIPMKKSRFKNIPKLVIWDLDKTLWDGILIEGDINVRESIIYTIKYLDSIGIVNSLASKNDYNNAWSVLTEFGLDEYFVYPKINWIPKSENIRALLQQINLLEQNVVFVDDNPFERAEVGAAFSEMMIVDQQAFPDLLVDIQILDLLVDGTAQNRRILYKQEEKRVAKFQSTGTDNFEEFLRSCEITLTLNYDADNWSFDDLSRCQNLMSRTNQLNLSGSKLSELEFSELVKNPCIIKCFFGVNDKFGSYGIVGFLTLEHEKDDYTITNLVISCRVAKKGIEHKLIHSLFERYSLAELKANFLKTSKNTPILQEMSLMGWKELDGNIMMVTKDELKRDEEIVRINYEK